MTDPLAPLFAQVAPRFWSKVDRGGDGECWPWLGSGDGRYGQLYVSGKSIKAHRFAYELLVGPIPDGLTLDHLCRNTACVNPAHLEPVSHRENVLRGDGLTARRARQTHCKRGHEFTTENTYVTAIGQRKCRTCTRERMRRVRSKA